MPVSQTRGWVFVINNPTDDDIAGVMVLALYSDYLIVGDEIGKKGTPHLQGYVHFKQPKSMAYVKDFLPRANLQVQSKDATPQDNQRYCSKDGSFVEYGTCPCKGRAQWERIERAMEHPENDPFIWKQYRGVYQEVKSREKHERSLFLVPDELELDYMELSRDSVYYKDDLGMYQREAMLVVRRFTDFEIYKWCRGFKDSIRRGYEVITIDPVVVLILYRGKCEYNTLYKKFEGEYRGVHILGKEPIYEDIRKALRGEPPEVDEGVELEIEDIGMIDDESEGSEFPQDNLEKMLSNSYAQTKSRK